MQFELDTLLEQSRQLSVLYVEDNVEARNQTYKLLKTFFTHVDVAHDGREGLEKYVELYDHQGYYYDLIISDIKMPHIHGIEMCHQIMALNKKQAILIVSAHKESDKLQNLMQIGITHFLHKPLDNDLLLKELSSIIKEILDLKNNQTHIEEISKLNLELDSMIKSFNTYVIASRTDLKGIITYASKAYQDISGYTHDELIGQPHNIVRHPDMPKEAFKELWATIKSQKLWMGEVKNKRKDGSYYWVKAYIAPYYDGKGKHIGYSAIREDITAQKEVDALLNNMGQGILSFSPDLKCHQNFSFECLKIFNKDDITDMDISELIFEENIAGKQLFCDGVKNIITVEENETKEMLLSLLPKEQKIRKSTIAIEYKLLENNNFMLVLTDISRTKELEKKLKLQQKTQKMLLEVALNQNEFIELKESFEEFLKNPNKNQKDLKRELHTFKGIFAQKELIYTPQSIHDLETQITKYPEKTYELLKEDSLRKAFKKDIDVIVDTFDNDFFKIAKDSEEEKSLIKNIKDRAKRLLGNESSKKVAQEIIIDLDTLTRKSVFKMLKKYPSHVKKMAKKLDKTIYPLEIVGDKSLKIPLCFTPFINSLIHLFNNIIDHGIEEIEKREEAGKDEIGTVFCRYNQEGKTFILEIGDDGIGLNPEAIIIKALETRIRTDEEIYKMSEKEILELIFEDHFTTKKSTTLVSGRGVGLSAVKKELEKINGTLEIKNTLGQGVTFVFTFYLGDIKC